MAKQIGKNISEKSKKWKDKLLSLSLYTKIFAAVAFVFFLFGIFTLGAFNGTGKSVTVPASTETVSLAYHLEYEEDQELSSLYINVGTVYAPVGGDKPSQTAQARAYYYDGEDWARTFGNVAYFTNIYTKQKSPQYHGNANYNWVALAQDQTVPKNRTDFRITFSANRAAVQVNEVVFLDKNGKRIKASVHEGNCERISPAAVANTLDAQGSFHNSKSYRYNFTCEEEYILESINGIELGGQTYEDNTYVMSTDYNSLGILVYALSTWIFGKSTFGLRLPSFLATFGVFILLFFFGKKLFKSDKWGLVFSSLFGLGGMFFTVGRAGTPMPLALLCIVASVYLMYLFYSKGIDSKRPVKTALPVLFSGLCAGAAFCIHTIAVFPCILSVVLFALGLVRLYKYRLYCEAQAEKAPTAQTEVDAVEESVSSEEGKTVAQSVDFASDYRYKLRLSVGFFVGAVVLSFLVLVLAGLPLYATFVRYYGSNNYFALLGKGIAQCFSVGDITPYTAGNAVNPFAWFIALKGATLFDNGTAGEAATVLQVNAQANVFMAYAAAVAFLFCTVYVVAGFVTKTADGKTFKTVLKAYVGLLVGMLAGLLPYLGVANASAAQSYTFSFFYVLFIALAFFILESFEKSKAQKDGNGGVKISVNAVLIGLFALFAVSFILATPMYFGWEVSQTAANVMFNWMSALSNGYYGLPLA